MPHEYHELVSEDDVPLKTFSLNTLIRKKGTQERWEYEGDDIPLLRRVLTPIDVHSVGLCMTIGAGIFVIAGVVAQDDTGPSVIISFLLSGIAALIASFSYGEFSARVPACGSTYSYVYVSLGEFMGWIAGWITIMEYAGAAAVAHGIVQMVLKVLDLLKVDTSHNDISPDDLNKIIATAFICFLTLLVLFVGIKGSARFCRLMSLTNISTILFICIAGSLSIHTSNWTPFFPKGFKGIIKGAARVFFAYIGFENSTTLATEVKDPKRHMPRGVIMTLVTAITLYMLSSLVITGMISLKDLDPVNPFVMAFYGEGKTLIATLVGIGSLLCMTATIMTTLVGLPRILFQMSKDGLLWESFSRLNRFKVPFLGTMVFGAIACLVSVLDLSDFSDMICVGVLINYSMMDMSVIALRFQDRERTMERRHIVAMFAIVCSCIFVGIAIELPAYPIVAPLSLLPFLLAVALLYRMMPIPSLSRPPVDSFVTPYVPLLPCIGILFNIVMIIQLGITPFWRMCAWLIIGSLLYFAYGIRHSKLNFVKSTDQFYY